MQIVHYAVWIMTKNFLGDQQSIDMNEYLTTCIDSLLCERPSSGIVIAGDFNQLKLTKLCNRFNLKRSVTKPTRGHS